MKKNMKTIRDKGVGELAKMLAESQEELRALRFTAAGARPKDSNAPMKMRRQIARMKTEIAARARTNTA